MQRPPALRLAVLSAVTLCLAAQNRTVTDAEVQRIHRSALLIDTHNDTPWSVIDGFDIGSKTGAWHTDISRLKTGGVGAVFFVAYVGKEYVDGNRSAHRALETIDAVRHGIVERYPKDFELATTANAIEQARKGRENRGPDRHRRRPRDRR
ncbi:MAG: membrane dipeptidase [Acidobacteriota bacterium]